METSKLRMLMLLADSPSDAPTDPQRDERLIERAFEATGSYSRILLRKVFAPDASDFLDNLFNFKPHILHFSGRGDDGLVIGSESKPERLPRAGLLRLLRGMRGDTPKLAVFAACSSLMVAREATRFIDCAIGVPQENLDQDAGGFLHGFYSGIGAGQSIQAAFDWGLGGATGDRDLKNRFWLETRISIDPDDLVLLPKSGSEVPDLSAALELLDLRLFQEADRKLEEWLAQHPADGRARYYATLARLRARRPATVVNLDEIFSLQSQLTLAVRLALEIRDSADSSTWIGAALLLKAYLQEDLAAGGCSTAADAIAAASRANASLAELKRLRRCLPSETEHLFAVQALNAWIRTMKTQEGADK